MEKTTITKENYDSSVEIKEPEPFLPESTINEIKDENKAPDWTKLARFEFKQ